MSQGKFILKSIGLGCLIYSGVGFLIAFAIINSNNNHHPHSMIELLYFFLPLIGAITGIVLGFLMSSMKEIYDIRKVRKQLLIGIPFSIGLLFLWVFFMIE